VQRLNVALVDVSAEFESISLNVSATLTLRLLASDFTDTRGLLYGFFLRFSFNLVFSYRYFLLFQFFLSKVPYLSHNGLFLDFLNFFILFLVPFETFRNSSGYQSINHDFSKVAQLTSRYHKDHADETVNL